MALISMFYGILIYMYKEEGAPHHKPHVHAEFAEYNMSIAADGEILAGSLPRTKQKLVEAWVALHEEDIIACWKAMAKFGEAVKIEGIKL